MPQPLQALGTAVVGLLFTWVAWQTTWHSASPRSHLPCRYSIQRLWGAFDRRLCSGQREGAAVAKAVRMQDGYKTVQAAVLTEGQCLPEWLFQRLAILHEAVHLVAGLVKVLARVHYPTHGPHFLSKLPDCRIDKWLSLGEDASVAVWVLWVSPYKPRDVEQHRHDPAAVLRDVGWLTAPLPLGLLLWVMPKIFSCRNTFIKVLGISIRK